MSHQDPIPHESIDPHEHLASDELLSHDEVPLHPHVTPLWTMFWVFVVLLVLTAITVWTSNIHEIVIGNTTIPFSGTAHVVMAMTIAVVKALLVAAFFMHLLYDKKVNTIVVVSTIFALSLFIGLSLMDLDVRGMTAAVARGEIYPGGNISLFKGGEVPADASGFQGNIVDYAQEAAAQAAGNPDAPAAPDTETAPPAEPDAGAETDTIVQ